MVKLKDIAEQVGTSVAVVSSVLNNRLGKIRVSEEKRQHILQVSEELGYAPNRSARTLVTKINRTLGLIVGHASGARFTIHDSDYTFSILSGMNQVAEPNGVHCLYAAADMRNLEKFVMPDFVKERSVDGVVLAGYVHPDVEKAMCDTGLPLLHIGTNIEPGSRLRSVSADMVEGTCRVLESAALGGVKRAHIYMPSGPGPEEITTKAIAYVRKAYPQLQLTCYHESLGGFSRQSSRQHGVMLAESEDCPELVITNVSSVHALYGALRESGVMCPEQVQFVVYASEGYYHELLGDTCLSLSQIVLTFRDIGKHVAQMLIQRDGVKNQMKEDQYVKCHYTQGGTSRF